MTLTKITEIKKVHKKILDAKIYYNKNYPFFAEILGSATWYETEEIPVAAMNVKINGMNMYYNPKVFDITPQAQVNFILKHEIQHFLSNHMERTAGRDHTLSNITQDMIINTDTVESFPEEYFQPFTTEDGKVNTLFVPDDYKGSKIYEALYEHMEQERQKQQKNKKGKGKSDGKNGKDGEGQGDSKKDKDGNHTRKQNDYSKNGRGTNQDIDYDGYTYDTHLEDEVPQEMREQIVKATVEKIKDRGVDAGMYERLANVFDTKKDKDYMKPIKRELGSIMGGRKKHTWFRENRKGLPMKGWKKNKTVINVVLDTSGSYNNEIEYVIKYIYDNDVIINLIQNDTKVQAVNKITSKYQLQGLAIKGGGGTVLQTALDHIYEKFNNYPTLILTDGYTDTLDFKKLTKKTIILYSDRECPTTNDKNVVQIKLEKDER